MNKEKIEQVNRFTLKTQTSTLCTGRKMLLPRLPPITFSFVLFSFSLVPHLGLLHGIYEK